MRRYQVICHILLLAVLAGAAGCYQLVFRNQDEKNVRRQLHVPRDVKLESLDSNPKTPGFFGREGLRISAVFMFDDEQFSDYLSNMEDGSIWQPVPFINYAPSHADEYSSSALQWSDLPFPSWIGEHFRHWKHMPNVEGITQGKYYGSVITARRGERVDRPDGGYYYKCIYVGLCFSELDESTSMVVTTFAVLDMATKRLYALIAFSG